ncbi:glucokinase [Luteibacter sp. 329MFSha]|uniref:glucokinase n=1 Tax=Luteibacter sp. 329MFSha TaxID=1798239 RepID=UPI0008D6ADE9|nr:glucokinase [Luteibacter sp. 329MFSha]SEW20929.1 glucokinase [Luteibacter sp. 329MFSha]
MANVSAPAPTLLADLGGTNVRFGIAHPEEDQPLIESSIRKYHVKDYASMADAAKQYFKETGHEATRAIIAAAGRIDNGETVKVTNNPWAISAHTLAGELGLEWVHLVNDFAAQSMAVMLMSPDKALRDGHRELERIGEPAVPVIGAKDEQTFVVVGPGTGLGVGGLLIRGDKVSVLQTEGGHAGFAAHSAEDIEILKVLNLRYGRVSNERLISGQGLVNLYTAICEIAGQKPDETITPEDVTKRATEGTCPMCARAVQALAGIFGSVAGDLVLTLGAWDGVYLTGGMTPILLPWIQKHFRERFEAKGRFRDTMEKVPTQAIMNPEPGLIGGAALAIVEAGGTPLHR